MRTARNVLLAGIAAVALAGNAGLALAKEPAVHTMKVQLPDGEIAVIQYTGNVPPRVVLGAAPAATAFYAPASPFADLDRIAAVMQRNMNVLMHEAAAMPMLMPPPTGMSMVIGLPGQAYPGQGLPGQALDFGPTTLPSGMAHFSMVSSMAGNGSVCMRTTEVIAQNGQPPKVVSRVSGNCGAPGAGAAESTTSGAPPAVAPTPRGELVTQSSGWQPS